METEDQDIRLTVRKALAGDESCYKLLYAKYAKAMYNICLRLLSNQSDAEDVLQESFIAAFKKMNELKDGAAFGGWLRKIVVNNCHQHSRKSKFSFESPDETEEMTDDNDDADWMNNIPVAEVHYAVKNLPEGCRTVFLLYTSEDHTHKHIAELLNIAESTSKSQYLRAKKLLREQLMKRYG